VGTANIQEGCLMIGNSAALPSSSGSASVRSGATLTVAAGTTWSGGFTVESNATLSGSGTVGAANPALLAGARIAPGSGVGLLTTTNLTLPENAVIDWELGTGVSVAGVDYDLLHVNGVLTSTGTHVRVVVHDTAHGHTDVRGARFTVAEWTGADPATNVAWVVENASPDTLSTALAVVEVNTSANKIYLSGLVNTGKSGGMVVLH
jgi:hypothetical protein